MNRLMTSVLTPQFIFHILLGMPELLEEPQSPGTTLGAPNHLCHELGGCWGHLPWRSWGSAFDNVRTFIWEWEEAGMGKTSQGAEKQP